MTSTKHCTKFGVRSRRGFSLLEVIVAIALTMVLLGAIWTTFSLFLLSQEKESRRAEESQIVRALHQRLTRDLHNLAFRLVREKTLVEAPLLTPTFGARGLLTLRRPPRTLEPTVGSQDSSAAIIGDSRRLQLRVFTSVEDSVDSHPANHSGRSKLNETDQEQPAVKFVMYGTRMQETAESEHGDPPSFARKVSDSDEPLPGELRSGEPRSGEPRSGEPRSGEFCREEFFLSSDPEFSVNGSVIDRRSTSAPLDRDNGRVEVGGGLPKKSLGHSSQVLTEDLVPEIGAYCIAYFDGRTWRKAWDSRASGALPVAIRFQFDIDFDENNESSGELNLPSENAHADKQAERSSSELDWRPQRDLVGGEPEYDYEFVIQIGERDFSQSKQTSRSDSTIERPKWFDKELP